MPTTASRVREFLEEKFLVDFEGDVTEETDLFRSGYIDSYGYVELVTFLEAEYGIKITNEELVSDALVSLSNITSLVERKIDHA